MTMFTPERISSSELFQVAQAAFGCRSYPGRMSKRNGDRARFQKDRKRKLKHRQRIQALVARLRRGTNDAASTRVASMQMQDEGGPVRIDD